MPSFRAREFLDVGNIVIFGCPINATISYIKELPSPKAGQLIMDIGSVKKGIIDAAEKHWGEASGYFVGAHPICGLENSGPLAAQSNLYRDSKVILTPNKYSSPKILKQAEQFWLSIKACPFHMEAKLHDEILAEVSHLPHLLAFALVESLFKRYGAEVFQWSAGGFRDFTRIASSNPVMWRDVCHNNHQFIGKALDHLIADLQHLKSHIEQQNTAEIEHIFKTAKKARDQHYQSHSNR